MTHFSGCQPIKEHHSSALTTKNPPRRTGTWKVRLAIDGFDTFKAAGEDGILDGLLLHGIEVIISHITKNFAACMAYGHILLAWRAVRVIFIPKPGRDS
jgi:hypothetical protein